MDGELDEGVVGPIDDMLRLNDGWMDFMECSAQEKTT